MKKNKMMRLASGLLVAVLITTSTISGTFAKYTSTETATDNARVAKWDVVFTEDETLFATEYATDDGVYTGANSVVTSTTDKLVAPGTTKSATLISLEGESEVAARVTFTPTITLTGWTTDGADDYCPLIFTVGSTDYYIGSDPSITDADSLAEAVKTAATKTADVDPNVNLNTVTCESITWKWEFEGEKPSATLNGYQTDAKDTLLGERADDGNAATVVVSIEARVDQID